MATPIVSTRVGDVPYFIEDGVHGYLAEVGDDLALWQGVERLMASPKSCLSMAKAARGRAQDAFGPRAIVSQTLAFYEEIIVTSTTG